MAVERGYYDNNMKISLIIPCWNEATSIVQVIKSAPADFEVVVVDNNSTDDSASLAEATGARVVKETTQGYGITLQTGFKAATGDIIATADGDGQYPIDRILELAEILERDKIDFISGSRFPLTNKESMPFIRKFGNRIFNLAYLLIFGRRVKDSQSGFWVFKKSILEKIKPQERSMAFSEEIKILAQLHPEIKFREENIGYAQRLGESKLVPWKHGLANLWFLFKLKAQLLYKDRRQFWFGLAALLVIGLYIFMAWQKINIPFTQVTDDTSGLNGVAAENLNNYGWFNLRFGFYDQLNNVKVAYTHHPQFFLLPTAIFYKLFGISETTTRLGLLSLMILALLFFNAALRKLTKDNLLNFLIILSLVILPGGIYYGRGFELSVFALPTALFTFSAFIFYLYGRPERRKIYGFYFWLSVIIGGLFTWFYYFFAGALWLLLLVPAIGKTCFKRRRWLIFIPLVLGLLFLANLWHFYILDGASALSNLREAYGVRTSMAQSFTSWIQVIKGRLVLNFTWPMINAAALGLFWFIFDLFKKKIKIDLAWLLLFLIAPLVVAYKMYQWITHPFGVLMFWPAIGIFSGYLFYKLINKSRNIGIILTIVIIAGAGYYSVKNLDYFYNDFKILGSKDIELLKEYKDQIKTGEICLGENQAGIGYNGIVEWYLQKSRGTIDGGCTKLLMFRAGLSQEYFDYLAETYGNAGFKNVIKCAEFWCLVSK